MEVTLIFRTRRHIAFDRVEDVQDSPTLIRVIREHETRIYPIDLIEEVIWGRKA